MSRINFAAPIFVDMSITNACNLHCVYCYADAGPAKSHFFPLRELTRLFARLSELGVHYVRIAGGEPLLHPDIIRILDEACKSGFITSMSTNATLLSTTLVNEMKHIDFPWVVVSLDGHNEVINNSTRGQWDKTVNGLELLVKAGIRTKIACVLSSRNADYVSEMIMFAEKMGVESIGFLEFCPIGRGNSKIDSLQLSKEQLENAVHTMTKFKLDTSHTIEIHFVPPHESEIPWELGEFLSDDELKNAWQMFRCLEYPSTTLGCKAGITTCAIDSYGNVFGCEQLMGFPAFNAGNINQKDIKDIWENGTGLRILRNIDYCDLEYSCKACKHKQCGGGCRAVAYQAFNDLTKKDPRCQIINEHYSI